MPIGAAALLLFRGGGGAPSLAPIARDDLGIDIAPGEPVDVQVLANDDLFGEAVTNFEVLAASGVHPEILPGNILRLWGLTPPPEHTNEHVINVPADPNYSLRGFPRPGLDPYVEVNDGTGGTKNAFPIDQDVTFIFDSATTYDPANTDYFTTWGGRHIRLIGGAIGGNGPKVLFVANAGSVFIEGLSVDSSGTESDIIVSLDNPTIRSELGGDGLWPTFYLQHCALTGINGTFSTEHADALQVQGGLITHLQVEECSISTGYQGFFIPLNPATPQGVQSAVFRWVDCALFPANARASFIWMKGGSIPEQVYYPVDLYEVYCDESTEPANQPWHVFSCSPSTGAPDGHEAVLSGDGLSMTWPNSGGFITGMVKKGPSPFGNFAHRAGLGYVSPWGTP